MGGLAGIIQHTVAFDRGDKAGGRFKQINSPRRYEEYEIFTQASLEVC